MASERAASTVTIAEVARFFASPASGGSARKMAPLPKFNPLRLAYIRDAACRRFGRDAATRLPRRTAHARYRLRRRLLSEPLARLGATVWRRPSVANIEAAACSRRSGVAVDYRATTAEAARRSGRASTWCSHGGGRARRHVNPVRQLVAAMVKPPA